MYILLTVSDVLLIINFYFQIKAKYNFLIRPCIIICCTPTQMAVPVLFCIQSTKGGSYYKNIIFRHS